MGDWYWTHKVLERLFEFVWLHPGWTLFIVYSMFQNSVTVRRG